MLESKISLSKQARNITTIHDAKLKLLHLVAKKKKKSRIELLLLFFFFPRKFRRLLKQPQDATLFT